MSSMRGERDDCVASLDERLILLYEVGGREYECMLSFFVLEVLLRVLTHGLSVVLLYKWYGGLVCGGAGLVVLVFRYEKATALCRDVAFEN